MEPKQLYLKAMEAIKLASNTLDMELIRSGLPGRPLSALGYVALAIGMNPKTVGRNNLHRLQSEEAWVATYVRIVPRTGQKELQRVYKPSARETAILDAANRLSELRRKYGTL